MDRQNLLQNNGRSAIQRSRSRAQKVKTDFDETSAAPSQYSAIFEEEWKHIEKLKRMRQLPNNQLSMENLSQISLKADKKVTHIKKLISTPKLKVVASTFLPDMDVLEMISHISASSQKNQTRKPTVKRSITFKGHVARKYRFLDTKAFEVNRAKRAIMISGFGDTSVSQTLSKLGDPSVRSASTFYEEWRSSKLASNVESESLPDVSLERWLKDLHFDPLQYRSHMDSRSVLSSEYMYESSTESLSGDEGLRSFYDLPILLHKKTILDCDVAQHSLKSEEALENLSNWKPMVVNLCDSPANLRSGSRFNTLKPGFFLQVLAQRHCFAYARPLAIKKMQTDISMKLRLVRQCYGCKEELFKENDLPHKVFSWSEKDFVARRNLNVVWIDIIMKAIGSQCLQVLKLQRDIRELNKYAQLLLRGFLHKGKNFDIIKDIVQVIGNCMDFLKLFEHLGVELGSHTNVLQREMYSVANATLFRLNTSRSKEKQRYIKALQDSSIINPIEYRYYVGTYESHRENVEDHKTLKIKQLENEIKRYKEMLAQETHRSQSTLNTYYAQIQFYRSKIATMTKNYEQERDRLENASFKMRSNMEKMEVTKSFCVENLERLKFELDLILSTVRLSSKKSRYKRLSSSSFVIKQIQYVHDGL